ELDVGGLGELLGVDGVGDARPEVQRLVGRLLVVGGYDLGGNVEGSDINDNVLVLGRDRFLRVVSRELCTEFQRKGGCLTNGLGPSENMTFSFQGPCKRARTSASGTSCTR